MASQHSLWRCSFEKTHTGGMRHAAAKVYKPRLFGEGGKSRRAFLPGALLRQKTDGFEILLKSSPRKKKNAVF